MTTSTTTNYGWTIPNDDELVKNGAAAIRTLGQAIDTTAAASFGGGLVHLNTTSFSAVATQSIEDVFSASYDYYRLVCSWDAPNSTRIYLRLRVSGTDNTSSNYNWARLNMSTGSATPSVGSAGSNGLTTTGFYMGNSENFGESSFSADIFNPFTSKKTGYVSTAHVTESATNSTLHYLVGGMSVTTSYTGFTLSPSAAANITGQISVFGYRKS